MLLGKLYSEPDRNRISLILDSDEKSLIKIEFDSERDSWIVEVYSAPLDRWERAGEHRTRSEALEQLFRIAQ